MKKTLQKIKALFVKEKVNKDSIEYVRAEAEKKCRDSGKTYYIMPAGDGRFMALCKDDLAYLKKKGIIKKSVTIADVLRIKIEIIEYKNLK